MAVLLIEADIIRPLDVGYVVLAAVFFTGSIISDTARLCAASFRNGARYLKSKTNWLRVDNWPMFSPTLVQFRLRCSELPPLEGSRDNTDGVHLLNHQ